MSSTVKVMALNRPLSLEPAISATGTDSRIVENTASRGRTSNVMSSSPSPVAVGTK